MKHQPTTAAAGSSSGSRQFWCSWRFRFSLRSLLIFVAVLSVLFAWAAWPAHERRQMRVWIRSRGGSLHSDRSIRDRLDDLIGKPAPKWVDERTWRQRLLGDEPHTWIRMPLDATEQEYRRAIESFPEADVQATGSLADELWDRHMREARAAGEPYIDRNGNADR